jgi:CRP/FNR family transcriptional regulator, dissimilatory nitrate respiration regulator
LLKEFEKMKTIPLFEGLPEGQLPIIARIVARRTYRRGEIIFMEGDEGNGFYIVEAGQVKIYKISSEGKEQILHLFGPGESFGEVSVFTGQGFPANAKANMTSTCLFIPRSDFIEIIRQDPTLALNMLGVMSLRLRKFSGLIEDLSFKEVPGRLAAYLLFLSDRAPDPDHLELEVSKGQLAALLGTIPETLSRILTRMNRLGLLKSEGSRIRILNKSVLQNIASGETKMP